MPLSVSPISVAAAMAIYSSIASGMIALTGIECFAIFPDGSRCNVVQRTDGHLGLVLHCPSINTCLPHTPPAGHWSSLALATGCQGQ